MDEFESSLETSGIWYQAVFCACVVGSQSSRFGETGHTRGVKGPSGAVQKRPHAAHPKVRGMTRGIPWHRETVGKNAYNS